MLYDLAEEFEPGDQFTIEEAAKVLGVTKGSVRARMMNIGRSMKSLGAWAPQLWDVFWDDDARMNQYDWNPVDHRAILRAVQG